MLIRLGKVIAFSEVEHLGGKETTKKTTIDRKKVEEVLEMIRESLGDVSHDIARRGIRMDVMRLKKSNIFFVDGNPLFIEKEGEMVPSLLNKEALKRLPSVVVDQGAVSFICSGADVMAPGIRGTEGEFSQGQLVVVREERFRKALAVGSALIRSSKIEAQRKGKVVRNIHFVGDDAWQECF
jgi:PUA-domain protein